MANKEVEKVVLNKENLINTLDIRKISLRMMGRDPMFNGSTKTINRAIESGVISISMMTELARYLNVSTDFLSGVKTPLLQIYCYRVDSGGDNIIFHSVVSTNEIDAFEAILKYMTTLFDEDDLHIELQGNLPIEEGTII